MSGARFFFVLLYLYLFCGLVVGSFRLVRVWLSGVVVLLCVMRVWRGFGLQRFSALVGLDWLFDLCFVVVVFVVMVVGMLMCELVLRFGRWVLHCGMCGAGDGSGFLGWSVLTPVGG